MFGMNKKTEESKATNALTNPNALNSLVKGTVLEGTISSENDIRIDGIIKGTLTCKAKVIIGPTGFIDGEVRCEGQERGGSQGRHRGHLQGIGPRPADGRRRRTRCPTGRRPCPCRQGGCRGRPPW